MQFVQNFLLLSSSLMLLYVAIYSYMHRKTQGAFELCMLATVTFIWTMGSLFELNASLLEWKLFWRNIQQIGGFAVPIITLYFSIAYTMNTKLRKYVNIAVIFPIVSVLLIFTNDYHHLMRTGYAMVYSEVYGNILVVHSTALGSTIVACNMVMAIISLVLLFSFANKVSSELKKQVHVIIFTFILTAFITLMCVSFFNDLGIFIPIPVCYIPSDIIMFYSIFKYSFLGLSPVARDKVFEVVNQGIFVVDKDQIIVDSNSYAQDIVRKFSDFNSSLIGSDVNDVYGKNDLLNEDVDLSKEERHELKIEYNNEIAYLSINTYPLYTNKGSHIGAVLIFNDITPQKMHELELKDRAYKDSLTQLLNRNGFYHKFNRMTEKSDDEELVFSVFMMDLDNFKQINDTYGHANGDKILCHFADIINSSLGPNDIAGRIGGEEFAVILPNTQKEDAFKIAEAVREKVAYSIVILNDNKQAKYTVSIGITGNNESEKNLSAILEEADTALYQAKNLSRNRTVIFDNSVQIDE